ncbi:MAG TPA: protease inhibitor I9 family protein, partial [Steroidobacteraceae bacterium]|nr:protease inhibitor I9 family protein [Steroidobacteraceae bacterium]
MKVSTPGRTALLVLLLLLSGSALSGAPTSAQLQQLVQGADTDVIVILRDQVAGAPPARGNMLARSGALASAQTPVLTELRQARATRIRSFALINAIATRVTRAEAARLAVHPLVQAVVPDRVIRAPSRANALQAGGAAVGA